MRGDTGGRQVDDLDATGKGLGVSLDKSVDTLYDWSMSHSLSKTLLKLI